MIVAFDTYYYEGYSYTVAGVFHDFTAKEVDYFVTSRRECIDSEYIPGELYKRELPSIMQCLNQINIDDVTLIIVDGFVWLSDEAGNKIPGLGKRLHDAIANKYQQSITIVGIAKNAYKYPVKPCTEVRRGGSQRPLYITCTEDSLLDKYSIQIRMMHGEYRMPDVIKSVDTKTKEFCSEVENDPDLNTVERLIQENNSKNKVATLGDLAIDMGDFESFAANAEKNGFRFR